MISLIGYGKMTVQVSFPRAEQKIVYANNFDFSKKTGFKPTKAQKQTLRKWEDLMEPLLSVRLEKQDNALAKWKIKTLNGADPHGYHLKPRVSIRRRLPELSELEEMLTLPRRRLIQPETQQLDADNATELDAPSLIHEKAGHAVLFSLSLLAGYLCLRCMRARRTKTDEEN